MEKKEITKEFIKAACELPAENRSFLQGYLQGCIDNERAKTDAGRIGTEDLQKTH